MNARLVMRRVLMSAAVIWALGATGCEAYRAPQYRKASAERVATVDVAVLSVTPWERYKSKLQPAFKLSSAKALEQAVPLAAGYETQVLSETAASLGLGINEDLTDDLADRGTTTTDADGNTTTEPVDTAQAPPPPGFTPGTLPSLLDPDALGKRNTAIGLDPMLRYRAASALFQEVAMLDTYVQDAAIPYGYEAFVVRLQISVFPRQRYLPYDVYTTLAFPYGRQYVPAREQVHAVGSPGSELEMANVKFAHEEMPHEFQAALHRQLLLAFSRGDWSCLDEAAIGGIAEKIRQYPLPDSAPEAIGTEESFVKFVARVQPTIDSAIRGFWDAHIKPIASNCPKASEGDNKQFDHFFPEHRLETMAREICSDVLSVGGGWKRVLESGYLDRTRPHRQDPAPWPSRSPNPLPYGSYLDPIKVIPMLVTDNVESAIEARASSRIADISLQLQAVLSRGLAGNAGLRERLNEVQRALYRDYDSLMTVAGMTEDTVQVRFGARGMTQQEYDLDAVTQNVTLLLAVPAGMDFSSVDLAMSSRVVDSKSGRELPSIGDEQLETRARDIFARLGRDLEPMLPDTADSDLLSSVNPETGAFVYPPRDRDWWLRAYRAAEDGTFYGFAVGVLEGLWDGHAEGGDRACDPETPFPLDSSGPVDSDAARRELRKTIESNRHVLYSAYTDLVSLAAKSSMKTVRVPLPPRTRRIDLPSQTVGLFDNGKTMTATLTRVNGIESGRELSALIEVPGHGTLELPASKIDAQADAGRLVLTFPSLQKLSGIDAPKGDVALSVYARTLAMPMGKSRRAAWEEITSPGAVKGRYIKAEAPPAVKPVELKLAGGASAIEYSGDGFTVTLVVEVSKTLFGLSGSVPAIDLVVGGAGSLKGATLAQTSPQPPTPPAVAAQTGKRIIEIRNASAEAGTSGVYHIDITFEPNATTGAVTFKVQTADKKPSALSGTLTIPVKKKETGK